MTGDSLGSLQTPRTQMVFATLVMLGYALSIYLGGSPLLVGLIPIAVWMLLAHPALWSILFLCLSLFRIPDAYPFLRPLGLPNFAGIFALLTLFYHAVLARSMPTKLSRELMLMLVLVGIVLNSTLLAFDRSIAWTFFSNTFWKVIATSLALAWLLRLPSDFRATNWCILASGMLIGLVAIYNKIHGLDLTEGTRVGVGLRFQSPISDPNDLALILLAPLSMSAAILAYRPSVSLTIFAGITAIISMQGIIFTQSRGALLGVLALGFLMGLRYIRSRAIVLTLCFCAGAGLFAVMGLAVRQSGGIDDLLAGGGLDESSYFRIIAWRTAVAMGLQHPLSGVGPGNFVEMFYFYTPVWINRSLSPHSTWFGSLAEIGIPGLVAIVAMLVAAIRSTQLAERLLDRHKAPLFIRSFSLGLRCSLVTFCVSGSFLGHHLNWSLYALVALASALAVYARRYEKENALPVGEDEDPSSTAATAQPPARLSSKWHLDRWRASRGAPGQGT